jgi:hypothetical protein
LRLACVTPIPAFLRGAGYRAGNNQRHIVL